MRCKLSSPNTSNKYTRTNNTSTDSLTLLNSFIHWLKYSTRVELQINNTYNWLIPTPPPKKNIHLPADTVVFIHISHPNDYYSFECSWWYWSYYDESSVWGRFNETVITSSGRSTTIPTPIIIIRITPPPQYQPSYLTSHIIIIIIIIFHISGNITTASTTIYNSIITIAKIMRFRRL